jgi:hypothetical protein
MSAERLEELDPPAPARHEPARWVQARLALGRGRASRQANDNRGGPLLDSDRQQGSSRERQIAMFYVVLIVVAAILLGVLYFVRGSRASS